MAETERSQPTAAAMDIENTEFFIRLGLISDVQYFLHVYYVPRTPDLLARMARDVYNCLLLHRCISNNVKIVVFNQSARGGRMLPVCAIHTTCTRREFGPGVLEKAYVRLAEHDRCADLVSAVINVEFTRGAPVRYFIEVTPASTYEDRIAPIGSFKAADVKLEELVWVVSTALQPVEQAAENVGRGALETLAEPSDEKS
jgi:hypothetical protein